MSKISSSNLSVISVISVSLKLTLFPSVIAMNGTTGAVVVVVAVPNFASLITSFTPKAKHDFILRTIEFISLHSEVGIYEPDGKQLLKA